MGCCNNPKNDEKNEFAFDFDDNSKQEPKLNLSENNNNLLDELYMVKGSQSTDIENKS